MNRLERVFLVGLALLALALITWPLGMWAQAGDGKNADVAKVELARQTVMMLDDLYKNAVVSITNHYVEQQSDAPAALIAKEVFAAMEKKGWHKARIVDATGKPKNKDNVPRTAFEKKAVDEIRAGRAYYEEVGEADGKPVYRAGTVVTAVLKQCVVCHGRKEGSVLGAIIYELELK